MTHVEGHEDPLVLIDRIMARLEEMEDVVTRIEELARECGRGRGTAYKLYRLVVEAKELLRLLRHTVYEDCVCGGSAAAGPRHPPQR